MYTTLYDELFKQVPHHPQLILKRDATLRIIEISKQIKLLKHFLTRESTFLEVGSGDSQLAIEIAKHVRKVYAIDVSREISKGTNFPGNFELIISDGCSIPVPQNSVNIVYSNQLMEHLHPNDALDQLRNIYSALTQDGRYVCITPNRLCGPHDISKYFDDVATGFHLKEYTVTELSILFRKAGFSSICIYIGGNGFYVRFPLFTMKVFEKLLNKIPRSKRRTIAETSIIKAILGVTITGLKAS